MIFIIFIDRFLNLVNVYNLFFESEGIYLR